MEQKKTVLIVEDEKNIVDIIRFNLQRTGYDTLEAYDGEAGLAMAREKKPDLILLDVMMPKMMGFDVCRALRAEGDNVPVIILTAREEEEDKILGLEIGADDYITKPFSVGELLARIRTTLRRLSHMSEEAGAEDTGFVNGKLRIDYAAGIASLAGEELHLTPMEYKLLVLLSRNVDKVLTHQFILREIWGSTSKNDLASLRVFMGTLRKKIERDPAHPRYIQTHVGVGYRMLRQ